MPIDLEAAKLDPSKVFKSPRDIFNNSTLTRHEKIEILRSWAYDEREKSVAEEENMLRTEISKVNILDEIMKVLIELGDDQDGGAPTKQG